MRKAGRVVVLFLLSLLGTAVLGAVTALVAAVSLAATALIVPGTGTPNANGVGGYMENFRDYYMQEPCANAGGCDVLKGVDYPASFWPIPLPGWCPNLSCDTFNVSVAKGVQNLKTAADATTGDFVIAGYSQGARVVSIAKMHYINGDWVGQTPDAFVFIGNPNRPNGGLLSRLGFLHYIPILNVTTGQPTPTGSTTAFPDGIPTEDWAIRWEGIADWPTFLLNPLAVANSILGFSYDHGTYLAWNEDSDPGETPAGYTIEEWEALTTYPLLNPGIVNYQEYGDTKYYTITPKVLPLVRPLHLIPLIGKPIADLLEPALRVIIEETGYARGIPFGAPIGTGFIPFFNPITLFLKLIPAVLQGINNFLANFGLTQEISLTPPIVTGPPVSPLMADEEDEPAFARQAPMQETGDVEQQFEGEGTELAANIETAEDLTLTEGTIEPEGTLEPAEIVEEIVLEEETLIEGNEIVEEIKDPEVITDLEEIKDPEVITDLEETKDPEVIKDSEENKDPEENEDAEEAKTPEPAAA
ncbi:PE-PPE domain-containing protein [Mycobacterium neglectum]|jgi:hypothetical protein|uniref:PE-PPE domain-containing protein n=1 Tax=Mycobacterium neglectum TaxID=242737 RepID=UPI000BFEB758|nr:PE-PPE domain-containing protein [Mycobacterium neglectum]